ncbi:MAG TPA: heme ABC transporter permease CcmC [Rhizomicrobium sp.]|nr:heme ABC transporter permease CcmC [Rhizomicrobium sp.]
MDATASALPWLSALTAALFLVGLYLSFTAPPDYQQGDTVRIMFVHVPAAWISMSGYAFIAVASAIGLINRHPLADVAARQAAPLGAMFTALALITGSLWGRPMWGTYWVWDGRLTSFLLLLLLYLGYIGLWQAIEDETRAARAAAILALVGVVNLPIIEFSVDWWTTLHQGESILRKGGSQISAVFLWPLFTMAAAYTMLFATLLLVRMRTAILERRIRTALMESAA